ncbi:MAG: DUF411 domain-containing protein [Bacteroidota bacterium]
MRPVLPLLLGALVFLSGCRSEAQTPSVTVYKTPTCGCCGLWADHMVESGFEVETIEVSSTADTRARLGVPDELASCHTAIVGDYVVEGHVPAGDVRRLLAERPPEAIGIAVPGMPIGSPGMEVEGRPAQRYQVMMFTRDGRAAVFAEH